MNRREFLASATASLALSAAGLRSIEATQTATRLPLCVLFLSGGAASADTFAPLERTALDIHRGPFQSIQTSVPGVHLSELFPELARRAEHLAILRGLTSHSNHTDGMQHAMLRTSGKTVTEDVGAALGGIEYSVLNPNSQWEGLRSAFRIQHSFAPIWQAEDSTFRAPEMPKTDLTERRRLLEAFDTAPIESPTAQKMQRFRHLAFDLLQGGGDFARAFTLPEPEKIRYGNSATGNMMLTARQLLERGVGGVVVYQETDSLMWDAHSGIEQRYRQIAPETDMAAAAFLDDITAHRLNCVLLIATEFNRTPMNGGAGRDHNPDSVCAILAGGNVKPGVHGRVDRSGRTILGRETIQHTLPNTALAACGGDLPPEDPRIRDVLK